MESLRDGNVLVRLRSEHLDVGVRRALGVLSLKANGTQADRVELDSLLSSADVGCTAPDLGRGEHSLPVRFDGERAVLVTHPAGEGLVEVTIYSCGGAELDGTTVAR
jgi:hypothetical protein